MNLINKMTLLVTFFVALNTVGYAQNSEQKSECNNCLENVDESEVLVYPRLEVGEVFVQSKSLNSYLLELSIFDKELKEKLFNSAFRNELLALPGVDYIGVQQGKSPIKITIMKEFVEDYLTIHFKYTKEQLIAWGL